MTDPHSAPRGAEHSFYADKTDIEVARHINLSLLMCKGISEQDAGFDMIVSLNDHGLAKIASIIGKVRAAAAPPQVDREAIGNVLRRFHRNSCYPEAMDHEVAEYTVDLLALLPARESEWQGFPELPDVGRKFIALYSDGSGSQMFWRHDDGFIDCEGDDHGQIDFDQYSLWSYLPELDFWCENRSDDPMRLSIPAPPTTSLPSKGSNEADRACTCHPDDNPPVPCAKQYALTECMRAAMASSDRNPVETTGENP